MGSIVQLDVMPRSTYLSENLNAQQIAFLKLLDDYEVEYFSIDGIEEVLGKQVADLNEIVENLAAKELLERIERGKYTRPNFKDPYVLGTFISPGQAAVAYWSALHVHGLTDRFPNTVFIKSTAQKRSKRVFGVYYKFIWVKPGRFTGIEHIGHGNYRYPITEPEMTLIDCFDQPRYSGDFPDLIRALKAANLDQDKMITYAKAISNISMLKRIGCIAEILEKPAFDRFISFAQSQINSRYVVLDPHGTPTGPFNSRWKLRMNITADAIADIVNSPY